MELYILIMNNIVVATSFFILGYYASEWNKIRSKKKQIEMPSHHTNPPIEQPFNHQKQSHEELMEKIRQARTKK